MVFLQGRFIYVDSETRRFRSVPGSHPCSLSTAEPTISRRIVRSALRRRKRHVLNEEVWDARREYESRPPCPPVLHCAAAQPRRSRSPRAQPRVATPLIPKHADLRPHEVNQPFAQQRLKHAGIVDARAEAKRDHGFTRNLAHRFEIGMRTRFVEPQADVSIPMFSPPMRHRPASASRFRRAENRGRR